MLRAGYGKAYTQQHARRLTRHPLVAAKLAKIRQRLEQQQNHSLPKDLVVNELAALSFSNLARCLDSTGKPLPLDSLPLDVQATIKSYRVSRHGTAIELHDKIRPLELAMKHLGMLQDVPSSGLTVQVVIGQLSAADLDPVLRAKVVQSSEISGSPLLQPIDNKDNP